MYFLFCFVILYIHTNPVSFHSFGTARLTLHCTFDHFRTWEQMAFYQLNCRGKITISQPGIQVPLYPLLPYSPSFVLHGLTSRTLCHRQLGLLAISSLTIPFLLHHAFRILAYPVFYFQNSSLPHFIAVFPYEAFSDHHSH